MDLSKVKQLLSEGAEPNTQDNNGWTPLHEAAQRAHYDLVHLLLENGANPNVPGGDENATPLHDAAENGSPDVVQLLIQMGADKTARNASGKRPL